MCSPSQAMGSPVSSPFFPSSLPGRQDFLLHVVTRLLRSCFISHMYESATLCPSAASGFPHRQTFYDAFRQPRRQIRRASLGKTYCLPRCRPASHQGDFTGYVVSLSHACSTISSTPYSWFAVRYVPGFYLILPPDIPFLVMPLSCWYSASVR